MMTPDEQAPTISDTWQSCSSSLGPEPSYNEHARGNSLFLIYGQQILCVLVAASALTQLGATADFSREFMGRGTWRAVGAELS